MIILGLDTSTEYAILVVSDENGCAYGALSQRHDRLLSSRLYSLLDTALASAGLTFDQVDAFAVGLGPGSFTGVRVAVTTMRTFAQVTGRPLVGIPTTELFANQARRVASAPNAGVIVLLPSRRDEVYAQVDAGPGGSVPSAPFAASYAEAHAIAAQLKPGSLVTGPTLLLDALFGTKALPAATLVPQESPDPGAFAQSIAAALKERRAQDPLSLDPMYVAPPAISQHKNKLTGP